MFLSTPLNKNQFNAPKVKIRYGSEIQKNNNQKDNQLQIQTLNGKKKDSEKLKSRQPKQISKVQKVAQSISLQDLKQKLNQTIYEYLDREYEGSFSQKSQYTYLIEKLKESHTFQDLISGYTQTLIQIVKLMQQDRFRSQPKFRTVVLNGQSRTKLKLILSDSQEKQLNQFKSKGIQSYVKKIEDQCQKHKREYIKVKQRNRIIENQMLKISLQFKNKRELYITEISRLTEILHSSFMEIGKMFVNKQISNNQDLNYRNFQHPSGKNNVYDRQQTQQNLKRKNAKSLSPKRQFENYYMGKDTKLLDFIPQPKNYQNQSKKQSIYQNLNKYDQNSNEAKSSMFNKNSLDSFENGKQRNINSSRNQISIKSNLINTKRNNDYLKVS